MDHFVDNAVEQPHENAVPRKPYAAPTMTDFGSVEELTRGTFAGVGADSGIYS
jgi:hypothetical protein